MTTTTSFTPEQLTHPSYDEFVAKRLKGADVDPTLALELFGSSLANYRRQIVGSIAANKENSNFLSSAGRND